MVGKLWEFFPTTYATIANLSSPHRFVNCQLIASASISRKEEKIAVIIFWQFLEDDRHVFLVKIPNSKFENF